ncbi:copper chaperone PCu(A)C [Motiliproteus sp. SC1-56]|uniref:copper chaperone PCu(A)C n=1 Tax=Motiliproteus sp. SC1-56 TaxID=2799565 RepID=UPI001A8EFD2B|nr:copper chaperone PCu(A)C [Motiliproteus sp. SC1-56]
MSVFRRAVWPRVLPLLLAALLLPPASADSKIHIEDVWVRSLPAVSKVNSGYMVIHNHGDAGDRLLKVRSDLAGEVEIHKSEEVDGHYRMQRVPGIPLPAGSCTTLQSGGYHLMFKGMTRAPAVGERVPIWLTFESAGDIRVDAEVRPVGSIPTASAQANGHHHRH